MHQRRWRSARWFILPMLAVLALVAGLPLLRTIWFSLTDARLDTLGHAHWIGLDNYLSYVDFGDGTGEWSGLLADAQWWQAVANTFRFATLSVGLETVLGTLVALVLNAQFPGRSWVRAAVLVPWAIPTIVSARMWSWMLNDQFGVINDLLQQLHLISAPIAWTASADTATWVVILVDVWKTTPFMALLILAALQQVPAELYEVARLEGIPPVQVFFRITLPLIRPALVVAVIFRALDAMRIFDLVYVLTPHNAHTVTMSVLAQEDLFNFDRFALGSAASTLLFMFLALMVIATLRIGRVDLDGSHERGHA